MKKIIAYTSSALITGILPTITYAQLKLLNTDVNCDPAKAPADGGCGIPQFVIFLKGLVQFLTLYIATPIAVAAVIWGGIMIMTAGGSETRVQKGKAIITTGVIGLAITIGVWLIINTIFLALTGSGVDNFTN